MAGMVMIDLETLGQRAGCAVLSLGAVEFDVAAGTLGREFHAVINTESCKKKGLHEDEGTMQWWSQQSPQARKVLEEAKTSKKGLGGVLLEFQAWLAPLGKRDLQVFGNGSEFDNNILAECYRVCALPLPWSFWNNRDHRTLKWLGKRLGVQEPVRQGTHHSAVDDAKHQARHAILVLRKIEGLA